MDDDSNLLRAMAGKPHAAYSTEEILRRMETNESYVSEDWQIRQICQWAQLGRHEETLQIRQQLAKAINILRLFTDDFEDNKGKSAIADIINTMAVDLLCSCVASFTEFIKVDVNKPKYQDTDKMHALKAIRLVGGALHNLSPEGLEAWRRMSDLVALGEAAEEDDIYKCEGCGSWSCKPPHVTATKEHVNVEFREIASWTAEYCSDECCDKDEKDTRE